MIPEFGNLSLVLALVLSAVSGAGGLLGAQVGRVRWMQAAASATLGQFVFTALAFVVLVHAFVGDDFSVAYVAHNSNSLLPWYYKVSAVWGAHEGSLLLWVLIMTVWMTAVALLGRRLPLDFYARVLGVMGLLNLGFLCFLVFTSNPFERLLPLAPANGADLNPLLQDFGLIVHPPMLYTGYVGFSVAFAFAVAALLAGRLDGAWARWSRPWTNSAWAFLTLGIALGSWWAYYELGWGGWWFWDPVENASFMPWLAGTALVHSLAVTEKRGAFKSWTALLAVAAFSLSLLGAFIVRSGVLTSVHAFAVDPARGMFILMFLVIVVGGSLALFGVRASAVAAKVRYGPLSREAFLLLNNLLFVVALAVVLLGTLYPLAFEAMSGGGKISIGPPWFNTFFVPLMLAVALALGNWSFSQLETIRFAKACAPTGLVGRGECGARHHGGADCGGVTVAGGAGRRDAGGMGTDRAWAGRCPPCAPCRCIAGQTGWAWPCPEAKDSRFVRLPRQGATVLLGYDARACRVCGQPARCRLDPRTLRGEGHSPGARRGGRARCRGIPFPRGGRHRRSQLPGSERPLRSGGW